MTHWSLPNLLQHLHDDIEGRLGVSRKTLGHSVGKGDASESVWLSMFQRYLPHRYKAKKAYIVDSEGKFSEQIDIVLYDQQYTPFIFSLEGEDVIPAESVYAIFEVKQDINVKHVNYAHKKIQSVRELTRTSLPVPHVDGISKPKALHSIIGGILTLDSTWTQIFGKPLEKALSGYKADSQIDCGCVASHGIFYWDTQKSKYTFKENDKAATVFLFHLIRELQKIATVPMIDIDAYAKWLK